MMRTLIILSVFLTTICFAKLGAQTTYTGQSSNTYYIIPPSSGCNGIWALDKLQWPCGGMGSNYSMYPIGCASTCGSIIGDTVYLTLCTIPCNITMVNGSFYGTCGTGMPVTTGFAKAESVGKFNIYPNPAKDVVYVEVSEELSNFELRIYDILGSLKTTKTFVSSGTYEELNITGLKDGDYIVNLSSAGRVLGSRKLTVIKSNN